MAKFVVQYCTPVESYDTKEFSSEEEAVAWVNESVKGRTPYDGGDDAIVTDTNGGRHHNDHFWYEVYDADTFTEEDGYGDPVYRSECYRRYV